MPYFNLFFNWKSGIYLMYPFHSLFFNRNGGIFLIYPFVGSTVGMVQLVSSPGRMEYVFIFPLYANFLFLPLEGWNVYILHCFPCGMG